MRALLLSSLFLIPFSAHAYTHTSLGTGVSCSLVLNTVPVTKPACAAHVVSSQTTKENFKDVDGNQVLVTHRQVDTVPCLETGTRAEAELKADMDQSQAGALSFPPGTGYSTSAAAVYKNGDGNEDVETSPGVRNYIIYRAEDTVAQADQRQLAQVAAALTQSTSFSYDAARKAFSLQVSSLGFSQTIAADYGRGVVSHGQEFDLPVAQQLDGRAIRASLFCHPMF